MATTVGPLRVSEGTYRKSLSLFLYIRGVSFRSTFGAKNTEMKSRRHLVPEEGVYLHVRVDIKFSTKIHRTHISISPRSGARGL